MCRTNEKALRGGCRDSTELIRQDAIKTPNFIPGPTQKSINEVPSPVGQGDKEIGQCGVTAMSEIRTELLKQREGKFHSGFMEPAKLCKKTGDIHVGYISIKSKKRGLGLIHVLSEYVSILTAFKTLMIWFTVVAKKRKKK